jgi:diadenosine tetraphosphate (Ap4A) HIT family hydrolase/ribosomal protein S18 acetylase RimI-like enzyme
MTERPLPVARITCHTDAPEAITSAILAGLRGYNDEQIGEVNRETLVVSADEGGVVVGGVKAMLVFGWLYVDQIWVDPRHRRRGLGSALLERIEAEARARGARDVALLTASWQAPAFYARHGYRRQAAFDLDMSGQPGVERGYNYLYVKRLVPDEAVPAWSERTRWDRERSAGGCTICRRGEPLDIVAELDASWVTMPEAAPLRGYGVLVYRHHAVELHELGVDEAAAFMRDARRLSGALQRVTGAAKLNYEIHGNILPHLHMHFFPRYPGDLFVGGRIDPQLQTEPVYAVGEYDRLRKRLRRELRSA